MLVSSHSTFLLSSRVSDLRNFFVLFPWSASSSSSTSRRSFKEKRKKAQKSTGISRLLVLRSGLGGKCERKERDLCVEYSALCACGKSGEFSSGRREKNGSDKSAVRYYYTWFYYSLSRTTFTSLYLSLSSTSSPDDSMLSRSSFPGPPA